MKSPRGPDELEYCHECLPEETPATEETPAPFACPNCDEPCGPEDIIEKNGKEYCPECVPVACPNCDEPCGPEDIIEKNGKEYCPECVPENEPEPEPFTCPECDEPCDPEDVFKVGDEQHCPNCWEPRRRSSRPRVPTAADPRRSTISSKMVPAGRRTAWSVSRMNLETNRFTVPTAVASVECKTSSSTRATGRSIATSAYRTVYVSELFSRVRTGGHSPGPTRREGILRRVFPASTALRRVQETVPSGG